MAAKVIHYLLLSAVNADISGISDRGEDAVDTGDRRFSSFDTKYNYLTV